MEYQALYRKYRPKTFDEVYGQEVIVKTLKNAIKNNKLTHAYLFIGPRGTGKTSIAKIFAKTINCENSIDGISCEKCHVCINNNSNEIIDVIEMDAASNNGVDEIREIKNHVTLLPTISKYKVYIIDEVHMLTTGAFNALLKTLEEPPEHVIFVLATTEPHKIPLTIISRCQSFEFKPILKNKMIERLKYICEKEKISIDDESLELISIDSNGGMRDAIGMIDQLNAYCDGTITKEDVILINGRISDKEINDFFEKMIDKNVKECFDFSIMIENKGKNFTYICEDIIRFLRDLLVQKQIGNSEVPISNIETNTIIKIVSTFNDCINDMKNSKDKKIFFDLTILKIFELLKHDNNKLLKIQTNVHTKSESISEEKSVEIKEVKKDSNKLNYDLFEKLMDIRLNNILLKADKNSLIEYTNIFKKITNNVTNLEELKILNLLEDCKICAGSIDGIIITIDNKNLLYEIYENYKVIEETLKKYLSKDVKVCVLLDSTWKRQRPIYVEKIKNKEEILFIDENEVLNKINSLYNSSSDFQNEFEDLLEIGGE